VAALFLYVRGSAWNDLHAALSLAASAASLGREAHLYLSWGALAAFCQDRMEEQPVVLADGVAREALERAVERGSLGPLRDLLSSAREIGTVRVYGCSTSALQLRLSPEELERLDAVMGHASFLDLAAAGQILVI
jgi:peroxiredoxin family protein